MNFMVSLADIKKRRLKLGINQAQLARAAGVSQSLIAKLESGRLDPSYSKAVQIFEALEKTEHKDEPKAKDVMMPKIITISEGDAVEKAIELFKAHSISQLPVMNKDAIVGLISETLVLEQMTDDPKCKQKKVSSIMNGIPPTVPEDTPVSIVAQLLKHNPLVAVMKKDELAGIITKVDLFKAL